MEAFKLQREVDILFVRENSDTNSKTKLHYIVEAGTESEIIVNGVKYLRDGLHIKELP